MEHSHVVEQLRPYEFLLHMAPPHIVRVCLPSWMLILTQTTSKRMLVIRCISYFSASQFAFNHDCYQLFGRLSQKTAFEWKFV